MVGAIAGCDGTYDGIGTTQDNVPALVLSTDAAHTQVEVATVPGGNGTLWRAPFVPACPRLQ